VPVRWPSWLSPASSTFVRLLTRIRQNAADLRGRRWSRWAFAHRADRNVPEIVDEIAIVRALSGLANRLFAGAVRYRSRQAAT
jgi:Domain of unknown function (DUF1876)